VYGGVPPEPVTVNVAAAPVATDLLVGVKDADRVGFSVIVSEYVVLPNPALSLIW
jgi:hypothetical protein